ncbi:MAG: hypothetical protein GX061_06360 [Eubacteriaceae bacterium]|jgi:PhnB protein|nr:hypothetical protein [Eubacteriaceae bacterium]
MQIVPTLHFNGNCREALELYSKAFGGKITYILSYGEADDPQYGELSDAQRNFVFHSELHIGQMRLNMCDELEGVNCGNALFLTAMCETVSQALSAWEVMKEGAVVIYPPSQTFFADIRALLIDRFGIKWGIIKEKQD